MNQNLFSINNVKDELSYKINHLPLSKEYSSNLQMDILNIEIDKLKEPILDIGCGIHSNLINYLEKLGFDVYGIDIFADNSERLKKINWFDFVFKENRWGTIISHIAFSNHFIHNHLRNDKNPQYYAIQYMNILNSLKKDGIFVYSPGLDFIEQYLDKNIYEIESYKITANDIITNKISNLIKQKSNIDILTTSHVRRLK